MQLLVRGQRQDEDKHSWMTVMHLQSAQSDALNTLCLCVGRSQTSSCSPGVMALFALFGVVPGRALDRLSLRARCVCKYVYARACVCMWKHVFCQTIICFGLLTRCKAGNKVEE